MAAEFAGLLDAPAGLEWYSRRSAALAENLRHRAGDHNHAADAEDPTEDAEQTRPLGGKTVMLRPRKRIPATPSTVKKDAAARDRGNTRLLDNQAVSTQIPASAARNPIVATVR